ncbi:hypothetical protein V6N11_064447 [Hibiscus sabdariffa]|uniref:Uncharacterized protein n=2 Tax=Hibiscus sabdariffa TaxID=183260 RepID=A0ABR2CXU2_9ROSI
MLPMDGVTLEPSEWVEGDSSATTLTEATAPKLDLKMKDMCAARMFDEMPMITNKKVTSQRTLFLEEVDVSLDEGDWSHNIHRNTVFYDPIVYALAIVTSNSILFYVNQRKIDSKVSSSMKENKIEVQGIWLDALMAIRELDHGMRGCYKSLVHY